MRAVHRWSLLVVAGFALTLAGCAASTAGEGGAAAEGTFAVPIEVDNNLSGLSGVSVYVQRAGGTGRRLLGPVESGQKKTFQYDAREGQFQLLARAGSGQPDVLSEAFQITPGLIVQWNLSTNRLLTGVRR